MKPNLRSIAAAAIAIFSTLGAGTAPADTVSGWDFSQWILPGTLSTNGTTLTNVLPANYSNLDPTNNAGAESAAFGTLYFNGQFGSVAVAPVGNGSEIFQPASPSLLSNLDAPVLGLGTNPFDSLTILESENQPFQELLSMGAIGNAQVVFSADLRSVGRTGSNWLVTFAGQATANSAVSIDFSTNGTNFTNAGSVNLTTADTRFQVTLPTASSALAFVRLRFAPPAGGTQLIDNVAIEATLSGGGGDTDGDGIPDASDRCPRFASPNQTDTDGDGRGNVCECTDQNGDGRNTVADLVAINTAIFNPAQITPLCDGNNDGQCNVADIVAANIEIFSPTNTSICSRQPVPGP
jgi:hypothetical protein